MRILVLGASFAGLGAARELRRQLPSPDVHIAVVDERDQFVFRPSLPWIVFGQRRPEEIRAPLPPLLNRWGVQFLQDTVEAVEPREQRVVGRRGRYRYDVLLIALGATSPAAVPPHLGRWGYHPLWDDGAVALHRALEQFCGGGAVVALCPNCPLACPAYEMVFHLDRALRLRGLRSRTRIVMVTYEEAPFMAGGPAASGIIARWLRERHIEVRTSTFVEDAGPGYAVLPGGERLPASLLIYLPAFQGAPAVRTAPWLTDGDGFVIVDRSLRAVDYPNIFAAGDIVAFPGPKNGRMAETQGKVAARNIAALLGRGQPTSYSSHLACLLDLGGNRGVAAVRKPSPGQGRTRTFFLWPGWLPRLAKMGLEAYYTRAKLRA